MHQMSWIKIIKIFFIFLYKFYYDTSKHSSFKQQKNNFKQILSRFHFYIFNRNDVKDSNKEVTKLCIDRRLYFFIYYTSTNSFKKDHTV